MPRHVFLQDEHSIRRNMLLKTRTMSGCAILMVICLFPLPARTETPHIRLEANTSFWWTVHEQVENNLRQQGSDDVAASEASGFNFRQGRLAFSLLSPDQKIEALIRIRLEERTDIIDFWGAYHAAPALNIFIGQMKIPSTGEVLTEDHRLDFISRTTFGRQVSDYSLSRTPFISSLMASKSYDRDLGIACKGTIRCRGEDRFSYFLMVGNGIGSNKYISGGESDEFVYTNGFGHFYYGMRLEAMLPPWLTLGAHGSLNKHDDMALSNRGPVYDLDRQAWTVDCSAQLPWKQKIYAFYGDGSMDDFIEAQRYRYDYQGWGLWVLQNVLADRIELGFRFDSFTSEFASDGNENTQKNWTAGVNYQPQRYFRMQLNYITKQTENAYEPDFDDDIVYLNAQFIFDTGFLQ